MVNSEMNIPQIKKYCKIDRAGDILLRNAVNKMNLSARGYHRVLKLARTIADLANEENISSDNIESGPRRMVACAVLDLDGRTRDGCSDDDHDGQHGLPHFNPRS